MTTRSDIQAAILADLASISAVENVDATNERIETIQEIIDNLRLANTAYVQFWKLRRQRSTGVYDQGSNCEIGWQHVWRLTMFVGYIEATSEDYFQNLIDTVLDHFADNRTLAGTVFSTISPLSLVSIDDVERYNMYGQEATFELSVLAVSTIASWR